MKMVTASSHAASASMRRLGSDAGASSSPSRLSDKLASRNGARHSVYWVESRRTSSMDAGKRSSTSSDSGMGAGAGKIEYSVTGKYTGEWQDGQKHGYGVFVFANKSKYEGEWSHDKRHGKGTFWVEDKGKMRKQFAGDWRDDKRHGMGTFFFEDGSRFDGLWERNKREGTGRMVFEDGSVYEGLWHKNQRSGHGVLVMPNGDRYDGHWLNDKKDGPGRFYYKATRKVYEGEWVDGAPRCGTYHDDESGATDGEDDDEGSVHSKPYDRFYIPELGLAHPERVVSESVVCVRQERILEKAFQSHQTNAGFDAEEGEFDPTEAEGEEGGGGGSVVFDEATMKALQHEFQSLECRDGTIRCETLPQMLSVLGLSLDNDQILAFLEEIGASPETAISFADCVDIMSLLAESSIVDGAQQQEDGAELDNGGQYEEEDEEDED